MRAAWLPGLVVVIGGGVGVGWADEGVPAATRTIYLVRHGANLSDAKADTRLGPGLAPLGVAQARLLATRLKSMSVHFDTLTSSTMTRASQTADVVHELLPEIPLTRSDQLTECTPPLPWKMEQISEADQAACAAKLDKVFAERFGSATGAPTNDIIVAHGNVIRYLVCKALDIDLEKWLSFSVAHTSITVIRVWADGSMHVLAVGDSGHVPTNLAFGTESDALLTAPR